VTGRWLVVPLALTLAVAACSRHDENALPGTLERDRVELVADADEFIVTLPFPEGATVKAGDVIVVQDRSISTAELDAARAQLAEAEARLEELSNGPRATTIRAAVARRDQARVLRDQAVRERDRLLELVSRNLVSQSEADRQVSTARAADDSLREAEEEVRAPLDATLDALPWHVGEKPPRGATVAVLLANTTPYARIHVPEPMRARVKTGTPATIRVDGVDQEFRGQVRFVSSEAEFTPYYALTAADRSRLSFRAEVAFDGSDASELPSGLPLDVTLDLGQP